LLTRTNPLALTVIDLRRRLETSVPALQRAAWNVFLDVALDPFFLPEATQLGHLADDLIEAPVWFGPEGSPYLVLATRLHDRETVELKLREFDRAMLSRTGRSDSWAKHPSPQ